METSRRDALLRKAVAAPGSSIAQQLCSLSLDSQIDGAAILLAGDGSPSGIAATSGPLGRDLAELELKLGEGPGHQALNTRVPVLAEQLLTGASEDWPVFASEARERTVGAVFAFPLCLGSLCVGVLEVCRFVHGKLSVSDLTDLSLLASLATSALLLMQAGLGDGETFDLLQSGDPAQLRVHQATGMVAQQTLLSLPDSLALMRAYAVTQDLSLWDVAERVVTRRIRMDTT
jgi:hypothetical protein